jgi:hypothetical protein
LWQIFAMNPVDDYILQVEHPNQQKIMRQLHQVFCTYPSLQPLIRFKIPFYYQRTWVCYLNAVKPNKVECVFVRGRELLHQHPLLEARGRVMVKGIMIEKLDDDLLTLVLEILHEAMELDAQKPYGFKKNTTARKKTNK